MIVRHPCPICSEHFTTKSSMKIHLQNAHFATGLHECPTCKRMFSSRATLKRHQVIIMHVVAMYVMYLMSKIIINLPVSADPLRGEAARVP